MNGDIFQEIDRLHSEWSSMEKSARLGWLMGAKMWLNGLMNHFTQYISLKRGIMSDVEKAYAQKLLEINAEIDANGSKAVKDFANDTVKVIAQKLVKYQRGIMVQPMTPALPPRHLALRPYA